jgi:hypothetical protein
VGLLYILLVSVEPNAAAEVTTSLRRLLSETQILAPEECFLAAPRASVLSVSRSAVV